MAGRSSRRPIPAIIFLVALSLISALVWLRVLQRSDSNASPQTSVSPSCSATKTVTVTLPKPATVSVTVTNGTNTDGLATAVTAKFKARGFAVGTPGNETKKPLTTSEIRYGKNSVAAGRLVQIYVPGSKLVSLATAPAGVTVALGTSFTDLTAAAAVTSAVAANTSTAKTC